MVNQDYLDNTLIEFPDAGNWTVRDAVRGVQIFGAIGSGKSSGSGAFIARKYLAAGWGGLVLCAKPNEASDWEKYILAAGRPKSDIIHFCEGSEFQFNPLKYETERQTKGGGLTFNLTELFMSIFKMGQRISGSDSQEQERFWENALKRLINRIIDLIKLAGKEMSIANMVELLSSTPTSMETVGEIKTKAQSSAGLQELIESNFCFECLNLAGNNAITTDEKRDFKLVFSYFFRDFPILEDKAQSTIKEMFLGFAEPFLSGILNDHFASRTNVTPEDSFAGKVIIIDFSVMEYLVSGIYAQCLFKHLWQQSVQRRKVEDNTMPVFLWIDESQYFINEYDTIFQTTSRSSMACTVLLTQNISNYYMQMGGKNVKAKVDSLLGNLGTLIFHANSDHETNEWASKVIGSEKNTLKNVSSSSHAAISGESYSEGFNEQFLPQVQPKKFTTLRSGGFEHNYEVDSVFFVTGKVWRGNKNYIEPSFNQIAAYEKSITNVR